MRLVNKSDLNQGRRFALACGASVLALSATLPNLAFAQAAVPATPAPAPTVDENGKPIETVIVTGIRQSLRTSQGIKKNSDVIVDSVTADDIGALPDRSVTEAIQRIAGVSIDRFKAGSDPDHFSVEGSGVVVRGLTYVRSEFNGREAFTANNGRSLSFADVPSELMAGVDVFKSPSADRIEGGISGIVNLRTRVPFDSSKDILAASFETSYSDFAEKSAPTVSILGSKRWETPAGEFGILASASYSRLFSRADRFALSGFGPRDLYSNGNVVSSPIEGIPAGTVVGSVLFPRGVVVGSQEFDRTRVGYSAAAQWRSPDRKMEATFQFLRSDSREAWTERTVEIATDNVTANSACDACAGDARIVPGTTLNVDSTGLFDNGLITGGTGWRDDQWSGNARTPRYGLQGNNIRRDVEQQYLTDDISFNFKWNPTERLGVSVDYQHVSSSVDNTDVTLWTSSFQNVFIDLNGTRNLPIVEFRPPEVCSGPLANSTCAQLPGRSDARPGYLGAGNTNPASDYNNFWRAAMDHIEQSEGTSDAVRIDIDYTLPENNWIRAVQGGVRYAERDQVARFSVYNWGALSEQWGNGGNVWLDENVDGIQGGTGGSPAGNTEVYNFPNFFRGQAGSPLGAEGRPFYAVNGAQNYDAYVAFAERISAEWIGAAGRNSGGSGFVGLKNRQGVIAGTPFLPEEINPVVETNTAAYALAKINHDFANDWKLTGNVGLRYSNTERTAAGSQSFARQTFLTEAECAAIDPLSGRPNQSNFCILLSPTTRAGARAFANGAITTNSVSTKYEFWLPSLNFKLDVGNGWQFRAAYFKGVAPPPFGLTRNNYPLFLDTNNSTVILANGNRPTAQASVGNPLLKPTEADNFDLTAEWYFARVGQLTASFFYKEITGVVVSGEERLSFTNNGATFDAIVSTPVNSPDTGKIKGFELTYQQTYDFLPGWLKGFGLSANYTYVESEGVGQTTLSPTDANVAANRVALVDTSKLPLQGLSEHQINVTPFYESEKFSLRLAYSWRSEFLLTPRDVITPFQPIINEATGQLDGSFFYNISDKVKFGFQATNLLNEVLRTSAVATTDLRQVPRTWYVNDRRYTASLRMTF
jgi:TonB-dependent receptor